LQEAVLTEGGSHWDEVANRTEELTPAVARGKSALEATLQGTPSAVPSQRAPAPDQRSAEERNPRKVRSYRAWAVASSALAACLLIAVGALALRGHKPTEVAGVSWGWAKPGGIPNDKTKPAEYLTALADGADEWFNKRPEDAAGVAKQITEFRAGCSQLIFAPHTPLAQADKNWLLERCRVWAKKLDDHLTALEAGADPVKVRGEADETIRKLSNALRERAG
jgi:hypothetical protein